MEDKLKEIYYNPTTGLISAAKLYHKVKDQGITLKQVKDFIKSQEISQLYKPVTKEKFLLKPQLARSKTEESLKALTPSDTWGCIAHRNGSNIYCP